MKNVFYSILVVLLAVFSGYILRSVTYKCDPIMDTDTIFVHSVSYDTIIMDKPVPVEVIKYVPKYTTVYEPVPVYADTALILAQYFEIKKYDDVLKNDSTGYIRLKEKVYKSEIIDRELYFEARCKNTIVTNTIYPTGFYLSGGLMASKQSIGVQGGITYLSKKQRLTSAYIGYYTEPFVGFSYGIKF